MPQLWAKPKFQSRGERERKNSSTKWTMWHLWIRLGMTIVLALGGDFLNTREKIVSMPCQEPGPSSSSPPESFSSPSSGTSFLLLSLFLLTTSEVRSCLFFCVFSFLWLGDENSPLLTPSPSKSRLSPSLLERRVQPAPPLPSSLSHSSSDIISP